MVRNAPARASLVRAMKNARAVKSVERPVRLHAARGMRNVVARDRAMEAREVPVRATAIVMKPVRLPVARVMATGAISARLHMVHGMVDDGTSARPRADLASPVRHMVRGIMVPGTEIVARPDRHHTARVMVARVTSDRLAMGSGAISARLRVAPVMASGTISAPRIVVRERMIAAASARRMASGRAMAVRVVAARTNTA